MGTASTRTGRRRAHLVAWHAVCDFKGHGSDLGSGSTTMLGLPHGIGWTPMREEGSMGYTPPAFIEIKMDAEIGSYQDDFDFDDPLHQRDAAAAGDACAQSQLGASARIATQTTR